MINFFRQKLNTKALPASFPRRLILSILCATLLLVLYGMIFTLSGQEAEVSGSLSASLTRCLIEFVDTIADRNWTEATMDALAAYFENPVRKFAHFCEYACMGALYYTLTRQWKPRSSKLYTVILVIVFLSAGSDEFHQLFVAGRDGNFADVCLDTCGAAAALFFLHFFY